MRARPFVLLGEAALAGVRQLLDAVLDDWCADWGVARDEISLACQRAWESEAVLPAWRVRAANGSGAAWLAWPTAFQEQLQRVLFAPDRQGQSAAGPASIAAQGAAAAWEALRRQLLHAAVPGADTADEQVGAPPAGHWRHASGALLLTLRAGKHVCHGLLDPAAVQGLLEQARLRGLAPRQPPLAALAALDYVRALADVPVRLPVVLGQAQVDFGSLVDLAEGDVIRLDSAADRPIVVSNPAGAPLFAGYPGLAAAQLALEVVPAVA